MSLSGLQNAKMNVLYGMVHGTVEFCGRVAGGRSDVSKCQEEAGSHTMLKDRLEFFEITFSNFH